MRAINEEVNGESSQNASSKASNQNNGHLVNGIGISSASNSNPPDEEHITNRRSSFESDLSEADTLHLSSQTRPALTGTLAANPVYSNSSQGALHSSTQPSVPPPNYSSLTLVEPSQLRARESHRTQTGTAFSRPNLSNWSISAPPAIEYFSLSPDEKLITYVIPHGVGLTGRTIQIKEVDTGRTVATLPNVPGERLESSTQQPTRADIISERHSLFIVQLPGGRLSLWNYDVTKRGVCGMMDMAAKTNRWKAYTTPGGDEATVVLEKAVRAEAYRPELVRYKIVFSPLSVNMTYRAAFSQRTKRLGFGFGSASPDDLVVAYHGASSHQPWSSFKPFLYTQTPRNFDQRRLTLLDEDAPEPLPTDGWNSSLRRSLLNEPCRGSQLHGARGPAGGGVEVRPRHPRSAGRPAEVRAGRAGGGPVRCGRARAAGETGAQLRGRLAGQQARGGDGVRQGRGLRNCGLGGQFCSDGCQSPLHGPHAAGLGLRDDPCCPWRLLGQLQRTVYHGTDWPRKGSRGAICSPLHKPGCRYRGGRLSREAAVSRIKTGKLG